MHYRLTPFGRLLVGATAAAAAATCSVASRPAPSAPLAAAPTADALPTDVRIPLLISGASVDSAPRALGTTAP